MNDLPVPLHVVPTLTEVVEPGFFPSAMTASSPVPLQAEVDIEVPVSAGFSAGYEELLAQRVLQRVDQLLAPRLQNVMSQLILEHTQALVPRLRQEVELVVRESVAQALEQEVLSSSS